MSNPISPCNLGPQIKPVQYRPKQFGFGRFASPPWRQLNSVRSHDAHDYRDGLLLITSRYDRSTTITWHHHLTSIKMPRIQISCRAQWFGGIATLLLHPPNVDRDHFRLPCSTSRQNLVSGRGTSRGMLCLQWRADGYFEQIPAKCDRYQNTNLSWIASIGRGA